MTKVRVKSDEPFEKALRRFKKKCNKEGLMQRLKEMKHYEKPSERRRRKLAKAIARARQDQAGNGASSSMSGILRQDRVIDPAALYYGAVRRR